MTDLLLDTHAFVWWARQPAELPDALIDRVSEAGNVWVSHVSLWEIVVKETTRHPMLGVADPLAWFRRAVATSGFGLMSIGLEHIAAVGHLPLHHSDPFDRLLIAQAMVEAATLVSRDAGLGAYDVEVVW